MTELRAYNAHLLVLADQTKTLCHSLLRTWRKDPLKQNEA